MNPGGELTRLEAFKREVLNLPNLITIGRLFLIPPVLVLIDPTDPVRNFMAALLFAAASGLDILDGYLARRQNLVTVFGKFMDPLADKLMAMSVMVWPVSYTHLDVYKRQRGVCSRTMTRWGS